MWTMGAGRRKEFDEREVLERAMDLFWLHGYESVGLSELVRKMGISRQSLYDTFGSKRGLFIRAIEHYRATQLAQALALLGRDGSRLENVKDVLRFFERLASDRRRRGCLVANALVEMGPHDEEIAQLLRETLALLERGLWRTLCEAQERGELSRERSPRELSRALMNSMIGLVVTGKLRLGRAELRDVYAGTLALLA
jgi:TetR/AcrR family transcriptional regulator, transcriptional repressor for nem operon